MKLGISNLAWDPPFDEEVAALLVERGIGSIDIAPAKYFSLSAPVPAADARRVRTWWSTRNIRIDGFQGLFFGAAGLNLLGTNAQRLQMREHFVRLFSLAAMVGARELVFGSPKNRVLGALRPETAFAIAAEFFAALADDAENEGVVVCIEANPAAYGCNFLTQTSEALTMVRAVNQPAIRAQLDTGTLAANGEALLPLLAGTEGLIGHIHASEPGLVPVGSGTTHHAEYAAIFQRLLPEQRVTLEMLPPPNGAKGLRAALDHLTQCYRLPNADP